MSGPFMEMSGDSSKLVGAIQAGSKAFAELEADAAKYRKMVQDAAVDHEGLSKAAVKALRDIEKPLADHKANLAAYSELVAKGKMDTAQYFEAAAKSEQKMKAATGELAREKAASAAVEKERLAAVAAEEKRVAEAKAASDKAEREHLAAVAAEADRTRKAKEALARESLSLWERTRTPAERYQMAIAKLNQQLESGVVSHDVYKRAVKQEADALESAEASAKRNQHANEAAFGPGMLQHVTVFAGALGLVTSASEAIGAAVSAARKEYEEFIAKGERAKVATMETADAQRMALLNSGLSSKDEVAKFTGEVSKIAGERGVKEQLVYQVASQAMSAKGELSGQEALGAVGESLRVSPYDAGTAAAMSGAMLTIRNQVKGLTNAQAMGYLANIGSTMNVSDWQKIGQSVAPAVAGGVGAGASIESVGAALGALTQAIGPNKGEAAVTAYASLNKQMREFFSGEKLTKEEAMARSGMNIPKLAAADAQLEYLQSNKAAQELFLKSYTGEAASDVQVRQLISGSGATADMYRKYLRETPTRDKIAGVYEARMGAIDSASIQETAGLGVAADATIQSMQLTRQKEAREAILGAALPQILKESGLGSYASWEQSGGLVPGRYDAAKVRSIVKSRRDQLLSTTDSRTEFSVAPGGGMQAREVYSQRVPSTQDKKLAESLDKFIEKLDTLIAVSEKGNDDRRNLARESQGTTLVDVKDDK